MNLIRGHERGQVLVLVSASIAVLLGFMALAVDVGMLWTERRHMQTAADAAAIAGAAALLAGDDVDTAGQNASALNSFSNGKNTTTVTINNPPLSGTYAGNSNYVEAIVAQPQTAYFMRVLGYNTVDVSTRAVSGAISGPDCVYALDPTASDAITISGGANITANCGVIADSDSETAVGAISLSGGGKLTASSIGVVGNYSDSGGSTFSPTPIKGVAPVPDPLAYLQPPTAGPCTAGTSSNQAYQQTTQTATIGPGTYCDGIQVSGGKTLNLQSGTYILEGSGGLNVSGGSNLIGTDVTIYNSGTGQINLSGGSETNLSAPTTEPYEGILFYQNPGNTSQATISGGSGTVYQGALYFPTALLTYSGGSSTSAYTIIVADTVALSGGSSITLNNDVSSLANGSPIKSSALYE
jgi:Flp pilus assembly protein TadG